jgi:hypothetical protein
MLHPSFHTVWLICASSDFGRKAAFAANNQDDGVAVPGQLFVDILSLIARLRVPPAPA